MSSSKRVASKRVHSKHPTSIGEQYGPRLEFRLRKDGTPVYFAERVTRNRRRVFLKLNLFRGILGIAAAIQYIQHALLLSFPKSPLDLLLAFRWFLPKAQREEIDLILTDLKDDQAEMASQKKTRKFIFLVLSWHVTRTIAAYVWDGVSSIARKVIPLAKYIPK